LFIPQFGVLVYIQPRKVVLRFRHNYLVRRSTFHLHRYRLESTGYVDVPLVPVGTVLLNDPDNVRLPGGRSQPASMMKRGCPSWCWPASLQLMPATTDRRFRQSAHQAIEGSRVHTGGACRGLALPVGQHSRAAGADMPGRCHSRLQHRSVLHKGSTIFCLSTSWAPLHVSIGVEFASIMTQPWARPMLYPV
jgi:hypothetical protein